MPIIEKPIDKGRSKVKTLPNCVLSSFVTVDARVSDLKSIDGLSAHHYRLLHCYFQLLLNKNSKTKASKKALRTCLRMYCETHRVLVSWPIYCMAFLVE